MEMKLGGNIRAHRKARGLTQEQLAEVLGVTVGAVYKWEAQLSVPELSLIVELADFFDCSTYTLSRQKRYKACKGHFITTKALRTLILETIRTVSTYAISNPEEFFEKVRAASQIRQQDAAKDARRKLNKDRKRRDELDGIIKKLYESFAVGRISAERFDSLLADYEAEQKELDVSVADAEARIASFEEDTARAEQFLSLAKKYTDFSELTTPMINEFIEKIIVHAPEKVEHKYGPFQALSPYIYMLILLPLIRYGVPALWPERGFATLCTFGYISWVDAVILLCGILGAITLHVRWRDLHAIFGETIKSVMPVMITMGSLLVMAYIMQSQTTGMMSLIAGSIAGVAKSAYPAAAVIIGSLGSFITGTGLGSNIMFAGMHMEAAGALGMNPVTVFAGQNAAASLGNLICPNNTVAACATVGEIGHENLVMKKTLVAFAVLIVLYMVLAMLYSLVLFPNFGM